VMEELNDCGVGLDGNAHASCVMSSDASLTHNRRS